MYLFVMFSLKNSVSAERIKDKMYESIEGAAACFRRLNGTHQFGCSSHRSGNVGVIHFIENQTDLEWLLHNATADPYMAVVQPHMFTKSVMIDLKDSGKVNGIVLVNNHSAERPHHFTHEDTCPNRYSGLSLVGEQTCNKEEPWNPHGTSLMQVDWGFPIFQVGDDGNISVLYECYLKHNAHNREEQEYRSLCALEMNSFMLAAVDSETCIRRSSSTTLINRIRFCDALGDRNIWSTLYPRYKEETKNSTVYIVAARLDGTSMFDGLVPGAMSPVAGIVTLLMTARVLSSIANNMTGTDNQQDKNVLFLLLNGESYDYIGSSRLVWDMQKGEFPLKWDSSVNQPPPLNLTNIAMFIELGQISTLGRAAGQNTTTLFCHQHNPSSNDVVNRQVVDSFISTMNENGESLGLKFNRSLNSLPPSSLQTFLAARRDLPGVVLTDHGSQYLNNYYHSIMDDAQGLKYNFMNDSNPGVDSIQMLIANLSQTLAQTLYVLMNDIKPDEVPVQGLADPKLVDKLLHCYLDTKDCTVFRAAANRQKIENKPASMYVGVSVWASDVVTLTGHTLALLVNQTANRTKETCQNDLDDMVYQYFWMNNTFDESNSTGACIKTTMNFSVAISPAFVKSDYNWASGTFPTWTESVWREFSVRMFLKPSRSHESLTLSLGIVVLLLSFLIVYFANSRSQILFGNPLVTSSC